MISIITQKLSTRRINLSLKLKPELREPLKNFLDKKGNVTEDEAAHVVQLIKESGGVEESRVFLNKYVEKALKEIQNLPDNEYKKAFERIIKAL